MLAANRVHLAGWIVQEQKLRVKCQGTGNGQALHLTAGEGRGSLLQVVFQIKLAGHGGDPVLNGEGVQAAVDQGKGELVID